MTAEFWTPGLVELLRRLVCIEGKTFEQAGAILGTSKNACIGKARRAGMKRHPQAPMSPTQAAVYRALATRRRMMEAELQQQRRNEFPPPGHCVYPIGHPGEPGFEFCGARVKEPGAPYCGPHHDKTHVSVVLSEAQKADWTEARKVKAALAVRERNEARGA